MSSNNPTALFYLLRNIYTYQLLYANSTCAIASEHIIEQSRENKFDFATWEIFSPDGSRNWIGFI